MTVVQLTGVALHLIAEACSVARALAPAMVVVEDVDLIAEDRGEYPGQHPLLFQLLNEMDGLADDADVVFVLTTNRADVLEPALAARPGGSTRRSSSACRTPRPGGRCWSSTGGAWSWTRRTWTVWPRRPRGSPPRSSRSCCAGRPSSRPPPATTTTERCRWTRPAGAGPMVVTAADMDAALQELRDTRNAMTRILLGGPNVE